MARTTQDMLDLGYVRSPLPIIPDQPDAVHPIEDLVAPDGSIVVAVEGEVSDEVYAKAANYMALHEKLVQARDYFAENYREWPNMTNAQKDAANRQAQRALANVCRSLLKDLSTGGD